MDRLGGDFGAFGAGEEFDDYGEESYADDGAHSNPPPSPVGQDERRMQVRAYNHWASLLGEENLPHIEDLEPEFLGDFGPYSALFDFSTGSATPTIQFIGAELRDECRLHENIDTLQEIPPGSLLSRIAENYLKVVAAQAPVVFEDESRNAKGRTVAYRGVLLPYSSDHDTIDFVYAVINWKEVADAQTADALLSEIDEALEAQDLSAYGEPQVEDDLRETAEIVHFAPRYEEAEEAEPEASAEADHWDSDDNILELRGAQEAEGSGFDPLPAPSFGYAAEETEAVVDEPQACETDEYVAESYAPSYAEPEDYAAEDYASAAYEAENGYEEPAYADSLGESPLSTKRNRAVDALGNPIGGAASEDEEEPAVGGITTAADYGLPDWDEEEPEEEDVEDLVNPLANIDLNSRLLSLVNSHARGKKTIDLASLSDPTASDEDEEEEAPRALFRPKAPSVDTLLTPEAYDPDEEEEAEYGYDGEDEGEDTAPYSYGYAPAEEPVEFEAGIEGEAETEVASTEAAPFSYGYSPVEEPAAAVEAVEEEPVVEFSNHAAQDEVETAYQADTFVEVVEPEAVEAFDEEEPLELGEELVLGEEMEVAELAEYEAQAVETVAPAGEAVETEEPYELVESAVEYSEDYASVAEAYAEAETEAPEAEYAEAEAGEVTVAEEPLAEYRAPEAESLNGLLGAVRDLAEAARTTDDLSRRALYEAVGRAFDVSIKAVIAAEHHARAPQDVIEHFPLDAVARTGPDMALVMVRRHANGETEVIGEVPHDSDLMENAQRRLASK